LKRHGIPVREDWVKSKEYSRPWGYYAAEELFSQKTRPTALFCGNDTIAAGAIQLLKSLGRSCPADVSIAGFADTTVAQDLDLTTVRQPCRMIAEAALNALQDLLAGRHTDLETKLPVELIVRGTTGPVSRRGKGRPNR
jgi:DNA-binding LacI/PurR family transcriptional regulator